MISIAWHKWEDLDKQVVRKDTEGYELADFNYYWQVDDSTFVLDDVDDINAYLEPYGESGYDTYAELVQALVTTFPEVSYVIYVQNNIFCQDWHEEMKKTGGQPHDQERIR